MTYFFILDNKDPIFAGYGYNLHVIFIYIWVTRLHGYTVTWLKVQGTRLHGYTVTRLHGYKFQGTRDTDGYKVKGIRYKVHGPRSKIQGPRSKVQGPRSKVQALRLKV